MPILDPLYGLLSGEQPVYIQTHNFPDHDAVASAYGLMRLLERSGISGTLIYEGTVQRDSLKTMIAELDIPIAPASRHPLRESDRIIIVDGCKGNKNVTDLIGEEVAVIDHHNIAPGGVPDDVRFRDIRPELGACSTLVYTYYRDADLDVPRNVSTALLIGLLVDTNLLTRGVSQEDVIAYANLYRTADILFVNSILRNNIQQKDLHFYRKALEHVRIRDGVAFCYFQEGCNQNLLGIIGDFFLSLSEVDFVLLCAQNPQVINFSVRSEVKEWNAAFVIQELLRGVGFGGGHADMAGGVIREKNLFDEEHFLEALHGTLRKLLGPSGRRVDA